MAAASITMTVTMRWWVQPFVRMLAVLCRITGWQPSEQTGEKMCRFVARRGFRYAVVSGA